MSISRTTKTRTTSTPLMLKHILSFSTLTFLITFVHAQQPNFGGSSTTNNNNNNGMNQGPSPSSSSSPPMQGSQNGAKCHTECGQFMAAVDQCVNNGGNIPSNSNPPSSNIIPSSSNIPSSITNTPPSITNTPFQNGMDNNNMNGMRNSMNSMGMTNPSQSNFNGLSSLGSNLQPGFNGGSSNMMNPLMNTQQGWNNINNNNNNNMFMNPQMGIPGGMQGGMQGGMSGMPQQGFGWNDIDGDTNPPTPTSTSTKRKRDLGNSNENPQSDLASRCACNMNVQLIDACFSCLKGPGQTQQFKTICQNQNPLTIHQFLANIFEGTPANPSVSPQMGFHSGATFLGIPAVGWYVGLIVIGFLIIA